MNIIFRPIKAEDYKAAVSFAALRPFYISERQFVNQFIWSDFYKTQIFYNDMFLTYQYTTEEGIGVVMPFCKKEDIIPSFFACVDYFRYHNLPFRMYLADEEFLEELKKSPEFMQNFEWTEDRDSADYLYDAEKLRTLSGRAYHKKKNHLNNFIKEYEGRFEYRRLCCSDVTMIEQFHKQWLSDRMVEDKYHSITSEESGIHRLFQNCSTLRSMIGGVMMDGNLAAYTIGSYAPDIRCAFIHIEKAMPEYNGLYAYINQQFLVNEFPDALYVNREDDLGQEGLRKAKLSYQPIRLEMKYHISCKQCAK